VVTDDDREISKLVKEEGNEGNARIPEGVVKVVSPVNPDKFDKLVKPDNADRSNEVMRVDREISKVVKEEGKLAKPVIPEGVVKRVKLVNADKSDSWVKPVNPAKSNVVMAVDREISKLLNEAGKAGNPVSPEEVVKLDSPVNPDKSDSWVNLLNADRSNEVIAVDREISKLVKDEGKLANPVIPEGVVKLDSPVNPDKFGRVVTDDDREISKLLREDGKLGNPVIPEGVVKLDSPVNPDKSVNWVNLLNADKSNELMDVDREISKLVNEEGKLAKPVSPEGVIKLVSPVNPDKLGRVVMDVDREISKVVNEEGNEGNPVSPEGVVKVVSPVNPDKFDKLVNADNADKSNELIRVDREISKLVIEEGKLAKPKIPEGVVKRVKLVNPDKSGKPVNPVKSDKSNEVIDVDREISKVVNEEGKLAKPVSPEGVIKLVSPVNPDKLGRVVMAVDREISKVVREAGNNGNARIPEGVVKLVNPVNPDKLDKLVKPDNADRSNELMRVDREISKVVNEEGKLAKPVSPEGVVKLVSPVNPDKFGRVVTDDDREISKLVREDGNDGNARIPEGVVKRVKLVNPDKFDKPVNPVKSDKSNEVMDVDREISKLVNEEGKLASPVSPEGVIKLVSPVNPDKLDRVVMDVDREISKLVNEEGNDGNARIPEGVVKVVSPVNPDKLDKPVKPDSVDKSNEVIDVDREISKVVNEEGNGGNARIPEGVVKLVSPVNPDKFDKPVKPDNADKSNEVMAVDRETSKVVREEGSEGSPVIPIEVIKIVSPVNPDKFGKDVMDGDGETSKDVREDGNWGNPVIPGGVVKLVRLVNPVKIGTWVKTVNRDKSNVVIVVDVVITKLVIEEGICGKNSIISGGIVKPVSPVDSDKFENVLKDAVLERSKVLIEEGRIGKSKTPVPEGVINRVSPVNPDKLSGYILVNPLNPDKSIVNRDVDLERSKPVIEAGICGNPVIPKGVTKSINPVKPDKFENVRMDGDLCRSNTLKVYGRVGKSVRLGGVVKFVNPVNPDKFGKVVMLVNPAKSNLISDVDREISKLVKEDGNWGNPVIPKGVVKVVSPVKPDKFENVLTDVDLCRSNTLNVYGRVGNELIPGGVVKFNSPVFPNKLCKDVIAVPDKSNEVMPIDREISKVVSEEGNGGNTVSPEGVVKPVSPDNPDKFENVLMDGDRERSKVLRVDGNWGRSKSPGEVIKIVVLVNADKSDIWDNPVKPEKSSNDVFKTVDLEISKLVRVEGNEGNAIILEGVVKLLSPVNPDKLCKNVIAVSPAKSNVISDVDREISKDLIEVGNWGNPVIPEGVVKFVNPVKPDKFENVLMNGDVCKSNTLKVYGRAGKSVIAGGVVKFNSPVNPDKFCNVVMPVNPDKFISDKTVDGEITRLVNEEGNVGNTIACKAVITLVSPVNPDKLKKFCKVVDFDISKVLREAGRAGSSCILGGVLKLLSPVNPDKVCTNVIAVPDKSNVIRDVDLEISKLIIEVGNWGNPVIPGGVLKSVKPVKPDKFENVLMDGDREISKVVIEEGNWGRSKSCEGVIKPVSPVIPDKSETPVNPVNADKSNEVNSDDLETSKVVIEGGSENNAVSPGGVVKLVSAVKLSSRDKPVKPVNPDKSNVVNNPDLQTSKVVIEEGNRGNTVSE